jgi:protein O-mannosyl-transferase
MVLRKLEIPGAYLAAAIFAFHPVHVESVAWVTEMKNTLSAVFYLAAMLVYLRFDQQRKTSLYVAAAVLFAMGLLSKTVIATLPGALLVIFWWKRGQLSWRRDVLPLTPFFGLGASAGLFTAWMERKFVGAEGPGFDMPFVERCLLAGRAIWFYLGKLLWPTGLAFNYPRWDINPAILWQYLFPAAALLLLAGLWAVRRRWRGPLAGLLFFGGTLFPALGFSNVYMFRYSQVGDHLQYLASLGIITLFSAGAALLLARRGQWGRLVGQSLCLGMLLTLAVLSWRQSRTYIDGETLYRATIQRNPDCLLAHYNLAKHLSAAGKADEAMDHYYEVLRLDPNYPDIHNDLAIILAAKGQREAAIRHYRKALRLDPGYVVACVNLADMLASEGKTDEASEYYDRALSAQECADFHNRFGNALAAAGKRQEAMKHYDAALRLDPDYVLAHINLANQLSAVGKSDDAVLHYQRALVLRPDSAETHNNLAVLLMKMGRVSEAIQHFNRALILRPNYTMAQKNLAVAVRRQSGVMNR